MSAMMPPPPAHICPRCKLPEARVPGYLCWTCATDTTPLDDPIAIAYRRRVAERAKTGGDA